MWLGGTSKKNLMHMLNAINSLSDKIKGDRVNSWEK